MLARRGLITPPCGVPSSVSIPDSTLHDAGLQEHPDELEHCAVADFFRHGVDEPVMGYVVEVPYHVAIDYELESFLQVLGNLVDGIVRAPSGPEAVAAWQELGFKDWLDDHAQRLLDHPVSDRGYAQRPLPPVRFGDVHPPYRLGTVGLALQFLVQLLEVGFQIGLKLFDGHAVHAVFTLVGPDFLPGLPQRFRIPHFVRQRVPLAFLGRFAVTVQLPSSPHVACASHRAF